MYDTIKKKRKRKRGLGGIRDMSQLHTFPWQKGNRGIESPTGEIGGAAFGSDKYFSSMDFKINSTALDFSVHIHIYI